MSEEGAKPVRGALAWVRVLGWQIVALTAVVLVGVGIFRMCAAWSRQTDASTAVAEDCGQITGFIADCVPIESKTKVKKLINEAVDFGADVGLQEIERTRQRFEQRGSRDMSYERPKRDYKYDSKEAAPKPAYRSDKKK